MKHIMIDCAALSDRAALHRVMALELEFPEWYGGNLDALYDCLTDLDMHVVLTLRGLDAHGEYGRAFQETLEDAARENPMLNFEFI